MASNHCYGVLGWPLGHSASPELMSRLFAQRPLPYTYRLLAYRDYPGIQGLAHQHGHLMGFNVTLPYKIKVFEEIVLESSRKAGWGLSPEATACGAVNCVRLHRDDQGNLLGVIGHNTDARGFAAAFARLGSKYTQGPALIMGDGGAAKAVEYVFKTMGIPYTQLTRKEISPKNSWPGRTLMSWEHVDADLVRHHLLIIQCTSVGMWPLVNEVPPLPPPALDGIGWEHRVMDLIYRPEQTLFLEHCAARGAEVMGGWAMLEEQAIASVDFWVA